MSKKSHIKHHYIPQCYLRKFANNNYKNIYTYDKNSSTSYNAAINSVCCLNNFYRITSNHSYDFYEITSNASEKSIVNEEDELAIECDYFAEHVEPKYNNVLSWLITRKEECLKDESKNIGLSFADKLTIANHIVIQYLRLPYQREQTLSMHNSFMDQMIPLLQAAATLETNNPKINELKIGHEFDSALLHATDTFLNEKFVNDFANALANNYWGFLVSPDGNFYTSDFPIIVEPHVPNVRPMFLGLTQYGAEMTFPISNEIVLSIWDREYFSNKAKTDCRFYVIDKKEERRQNHFRYFYARRHVFCYHNDFNLIDFCKIVSGNKHIFMGQGKNNDK